MPTVITTQPTEEPISLQELKDHLRIESSEWDGELTWLIQEGRRYVEMHTGRALITQTWQLLIDDMFDPIALPYAPLQSITSIQYQDLNNATQTLSTDNYTVDANAIPGKIVQSYGGTYPSVYPDINSVTITFVAGFGDDKTDVPEEYKRAIKMYCQWVYDHDDTAKSVLDIFINQSKINWYSPEH